MLSVSKSLQSSTSIEETAAESNQLKPVVSNQQMQQSAEERAETFQETAQDLGSLEGMSNATSAVGTLIDALVPSEGDTASLSISFNIPVHPLVKITIGLSGWAGRFGNNVILNSSLSVGAKLEGKVKALWLELESYLSVSGSGYLKTLGDNGSEAFSFMGLAVHEMIAKHNEKIASLIMGKQERSQLISTMSDGEFSELGVGLNVSAGASFSSGSSDDGEASEDGTSAGGYFQGVNASVGYTKGIRFTDQNNDGNLEEQKTAKASGTFGIGLDLSKFGLSDISGNTGLGLNIFYTDDQISRIRANLDFSATMQPTTFGPSFIAGCFAEVTMEIIDILRNGADHFSGSTGVRLGKIADSLSNLTVADNIASRLGNQFSDDIFGNPNFKSTGKFSVIMSWNSNGGAELMFKMVKATTSGINLNVASISASFEDAIFLHTIPFEA